MSLAGALVAGTEVALGGRQEPVALAPVHTSASSKLVVISAVLPSMTLAEQYLSCERDGALDGGRRQARPVTTKCMWICVNTFRIRRGALGPDLHRAAPHVVASALQDQHHVVGGTAPGAGEHGLHRSRRQVAPAAVRRPVHRQQVAAAGLGDERHAPGRDPVDLAPMAAIVPWACVGVVAPDRRGHRILRCSIEAATLFFIRFSGVTKIPRNQTVVSSTAWVDSARQRCLGFFVRPGNACG